MWTKRFIIPCQRQFNYRRTFNLTNKFHTNVNRRLFQTPKYPEDKRNLKIRSTLYYITAAGVVAIGMSYAAVPLYRMFCQAYSYGGTTNVGHDGSKIQEMKAVKDRELTIKFNADISASMRWNFKPQQIEIKV